MALSNMKVAQAGSAVQARQTVAAPRVVSPTSTTTRRVAHSVPAAPLVPSVLRAQASASSPQPRTRRHVISAAAAVEAPPLPSLQAGVTNDKPTVVITGASSGLGLNAAKSMAASGKWHVVMACRDFAKAEREARKIGIPKGSYTVMHLDLAALDSVRIFADMYKASGRRLDALVCNAAVYLPTAKEPVYSADGFELSIATNHLGHFLLVQLLLDKLKEAPNKDPRCIIVGSITGNTNTLAGNVPPKANLGDLSGLENMQPMADGGEFDGAKAYKDAKVCNMLTMRQLHKRLHEQSGITFASLYPGCIATSGLFRNHVPLFQYLFPRFQKNITKGYVSEEEAGKRLMEVVSNPDLKKSGVYWSFSNTTGSFENQLSEEASDDAKGSRLWDVSMKLVGLA